MVKLDRKLVKEKLEMNSKNYMSVCNSCSCTSGGGGCAACNQTCKGCKDKNENIAEARNAYNRK